MAKPTKRKPRKETTMPPTTQTNDERAELERAELERAAERELRPYDSFRRSAPPTIEEVAAVQRYFVDRRDELTREVSEIEAMIGFVAQSSELATRVAKIELFLGIK
jgi:hypothetical protein